jgi:hypothetical protein
MSIFAPVAAFTAPVKINVPNESGGFDEIKFNFRFKGMGRKQYKDLIARANASLDGDQLVVDETVLGFAKSKSANADAAPFSIDGLDELLDAHPGAVNQISGTFVRHLLGAKSGN